jgi:hypothetical protein
MGQGFIPDPAFHDALRDAEGFRELDEIEVHGGTFRPAAKSPRNRAREEFISVTRILGRKTIERLMTTGTGQSAGEGSGFMRR